MFDFGASSLSIIPTSCSLFTRLFIWTRILGKKSILVAPIFDLRGYWLIHCVLGWLRVLISLIFCQTHIRILIKCPCRPLSFPLTSSRAFLSSFSEIDVHYETFPSSPNEIVLRLWQSSPRKKTRITVYCLKKTHKILQSNYKQLGARSI